MLEILWYLSAPQQKKRKPKFTQRPVFWQWAVIVLTALILAYAIIAS